MILFHAKRISKTETYSGIPMELISVAALAENHVIGNDGEVPWNIPEDRQQYRMRIADAPVILGRVTFDLMRDDLPSSIQIVISRSDHRHDTQTTFSASSVSEAVDVVEDHNADSAYVIGGGSIFQLFQPHLDRMVLSRIPGEYDGDAFYPEWDRDSWSLTESTEYEEFSVEEWARTPDQN